MKNKPDVSTVIYEINKIKGHRKGCKGLSNALESDGYMRSIVNWVKVTSPDRIDALLEHIEDLQRKVEALAGENITSRNAVQTFCDVVQSNTDTICEEVGQEGVKAILAAMSATGSMTATDAALTEVRAQGVDAFADSCENDVVFVEPEDEEHYVLMVENARAFAQQLRKESGQ